MIVIFPASVPSSMSAVMPTPRSACSSAPRVARSLPWRKFLARVRSSVSVSSWVATAVGPGFVTDATPAIGTSSSVSLAAGNGSFGSRSRALTRIEFWPGLIATVSVVSYWTLPSAVATRVPAGMVSSPGAPDARVNSTTPAGRPPRTRSIPSSATTLSSASVLAVSTKPDW